MSILVSIFLSIIVVCFIQICIIPMYKLSKREKVRQQLSQLLHNLYDQQYEDNMNHNLEQIMIKRLANKKFFFTFRVYNNDLKYFNNYVPLHEIFLHVDKYIEDQGHFIVDYDIINHINNKKNAPNKTIIKIVVGI